MGILRLWDFIHDMSGRDRFGPIGTAGGQLYGVGRCTFVTLLTSRCCVS